ASSHRPLSINRILLSLLYLHQITELSPATSQPQQAEPGRPRIPLNLLTNHRLLLAAMILGTKIISDQPLLCKRLSKVADISQTEIDHLKRHVLHTLNFRLCWTTPKLALHTQTILTPTPPPALPPCSSSSSTHNNI
ncbi:hypothetical protein PTTG_29620, partial [Puccinia triticina 1-1 BBBD Race 1]